MSAVRDTYIKPLLPEAKPLDKETNSISAASSQSLYPLTGKTNQVQLQQQGLRQKNLMKSQKKYLSGDVLPKETQVIILKQHLK